MNDRLVLINRCCIRLLMLHCPGKLLHQQVKMGVLHLGTKDSLYMQDKNQSLCPICMHSTYNVLSDDDGWNCNKRESAHFTRDWDLLIDVITSCDYFQFAVPILKRIVENKIKEEEAKAQTTLGDF